MNYILRLVVILILLYVFFAVFDIIKERIHVYLSQTLTRDMREDISEKVERILLTYFDNHSTGGCFYNPPMFLWKHVLLSPVLLLILDEDTSLVDTRTE